MNSDGKTFADSVGITFTDKHLLRQAFVHRSYVNEHRGEKIEHNERLEFLGDAVLELVVTNFLFEKYPDKTEGDLTAYRAALVNTQSLSESATALGMNDYLYLSRGEQKDTGRARQYILANTYEAFIGALFLDNGYEGARAFITTTLLHKMDSVIEGRLWQDSKSFFQEKAQEVHGVTPVYELLSESGPDHDKQFVVGVYIADECIAKGSGKSKQEAEQEAADHALESKGWR
jgi:ribonuclease-3